MFSKPSNEKRKQRAENVRRHTELLGVTFDPRYVHAAHVSYRGRDVAPSVVVYSAAHSGNVGAVLRDAIERGDLPDAPAVFGLSPSHAHVGQKQFPTRFSFKECVSNIRTMRDLPLDAVSREKLEIVLKMRRDRIGTFGVVDEATLASVEKIADEAGLRLLAVDHTGFAWRRALEAFGNADGVIELTDDHVYIYVFTKDLFRATLFPRDNDSGWTYHVGTYIKQLRSDTNGEIDPGHLVVFGTSLHPSLSEQLLLESNANYSLLEVAHPQTNSLEYGPPWVLAYGLGLYEG